MPVRYNDPPRSADAKSTERRNTYYLSPILIGEDVAEKLLKLRVEYQQNQEEMIKYQKQYRDTAKFFKEESRYWLKHYRAVCLLIPWVAAEYPGDCVLKDPYDFPEELYPFLDYITGIST